MNIRSFALLAGISGLLSATAAIGQAGNVTVAAHGDTVSIVGDAAGNVVFCQNLANGLVSVQGAPGTTINRKQKLTVTSLAQNWLIDMRGGDDIVSLVDMEFPAMVSLTVDLGSGEDELHVESVAGLRRLTAWDGPTAEAAHDRLVVKDTELAQDVVITCGAGNDTVAVSVVARLVDVFTGDGDDGLTALGCDLEVGLLFDAGAGNDLVFAGGVLAPFVEILGGPHTGTRVELTFNLLAGDVFVDMDFIVFPSTIDLFDSAVGFEREYDLIGDILTTDLEEALLELAEARGLDP